MFIVDAHLDLSMNAMEWNRDLRKSVDDIRQREKGMTDKPDRGNNTVSFPELRKAKRSPSTPRKYASPQISPYITT